MVVHPGACCATRGLSAARPTPAPEPAPALAIRAGRTPAGPEISGSAEAPGVRKNSQRSRPPGPRRPMTEQDTTPRPTHGRIWRNTPPPLASTYLGISHNCPADPVQPPRAAEGQQATSARGFRRRRGARGSALFVTGAGAPGTVATPAPTTPTSRATPGDSRFMGGAEDSKILQPAPIEYRPFAREKSIIQCPAPLITPIVAFCSLRVAPHLSDSGDQVLNQDLGPHALLRI